MNASRPLLFVSLLSAAATVGAQDLSPPDSDVSLVTPEVVITARRSAESVFESPYFVDSIGQGEIHDRLHRTVPEALRFTSGVMVQKTAHGQGSPFIRGFTGFRNVMLIDGVRLNNSVFRDGPNEYWNTIDPYSLDRLEIVKGPGSVMWGSDAIGGTVNALTKGPATYGEGFNDEGRAYYRVSSAERSHTGRGEYGFTFGEHTGVLLGLTGKDYGDVEGGRDTGRQPDTGYDEYDGDIKFEHFFTPDTRLVFLHQRVRQNNVPRTHSTRHAISFSNTTVGSDRQRDTDIERELTYLQLHAENLDGFVDTLRASVSWHDQSEDQDRTRSTGAKQYQGIDTGTFGFWTQLESDSPIGRLTYGIEYYHDNVNSYLTGNAIQGPVADDSSYDLLGVFLQDRIALGDRLDLTLGGRFDYASVTARSVMHPVTGTRIRLSDDYHNLIGSARVTYAVVPERLNLFGGVSQGYRAPNLSDLTRLDAARTDEIETPAPGLDPEHFLTYEAGVKLQDHQWVVQTSYFYTDIKDMIVRTPTGAVIGGDFEVTKQNAGDGFVQGIELETAFQLNHNFRLFGNITWMDGEVDTFPTAAPVKRAEYLDRVMPLTANIGIRYDSAKRHWWSEFTATIVDEADHLSTRDRGDTQRIPPGGTPGYTLLSVRGGWKVHRQVDLTFGVENLADGDYRVHGSGSNEPGRNFVLGVDVTF